MPVAVLPLLVVTRRQLLTVVAAQAVLPSVVLASVSSPPSRALLSIGVVASVAESSATVESRTALSTPDWAPSISVPGLKSTIVLTGLSPQPVAATPVTAIANASTQPVMRLDLRFPIDMSTP